ncbi:MAG: TIGR01777 family protein [Gammaproteobacteria bacterium HGW-Gammaproteobacteria-11]|nr:MAG: TIGR01777 family protein [Gammaproteobacteria bacterium HGW-Gammaproteobacteria-11]
MHVLVTGGTGLIGSALCKRLVSDGHQVSVLSRRPERVAGVCGHQVRGVGQLSDLNEAGIEAVVNLAGEPIADKPWTDKRKAVLWASRVTLTEQLVSWIGSLSVKPKVLVSGSAVGWYGDGGDSLITESSPARVEYTHTLCDAWESAAKRAASHGIRVCLLRTGLVLAADGGFLQRLRMPFKLGLGGPIGSGQHYMPWVHLEDMVGIIQFLLQSPECKGPYNATAPNPVTNKVFAQRLGKAFGRPAFIPLPGFALKLALGEMAGLLLTGQNAVPEKLLKAGYRFRFDQLDTALADVVHP